MPLLLVWKLNVVKIYLGIGSNIEPKKNISAGLRSLETLFFILDVSPTYLAPSFGFKGDDFHNLVVAAETELSITDVLNALRTIEFEHGRPEDAIKFAPRSLDIDLLLFGDYVGKLGGYKMPRSDIDKFDFVLRPLQDIAPDDLHPVSGKSFSELWQGMSLTIESPLKLVDKKK
jgi:2-amino-4-hydroxy-6-hydroxymethyldihydropteridine diphosphokinase